MHFVRAIFRLQKERRCLPEGFILFPLMCNTSIRARRVQSSSSMSFLFNLSLVQDCRKGGTVDGEPMMFLILTFIQGIKLTGFTVGGGS